MTWSVNNSTSVVAGKEGRKMRRKKFKSKQQAGNGI
jgi:hypothetical protein